MIAHQQHLLDASQQIVLCDYLHEQKRYAESIPILEPLVDRHPDVMEYRTRLMTAYKHSSRDEQLQKLLADTDAHFRQAGRWTEANIALLAKSCLDNELFKAAVKYYGEVIPLHQRTAANRGIGQGTLSNYYSNQARAYSGLGQTKEAVDAAAAAIVAWGPSYNQRESTLDSLEYVLKNAKDLDEYVQSLDNKAETEHEDSPIIRERIGMVYAERRDYKKAIEQYRIALALKPSDVETHKKLIAAYDAIHDQKGAIEETLALVDLDRHNLELYKKLAERLKTDDALSERAMTTIVEAAPSEAEHHQAFAEMLEQQNRWADAIDQWKQVAELRSLEPNGLLHLAEAQIHEREFKNAQETLEKLHRTEWPSRFQDVRTKIQRLEEQIRQSRVSGELPRYHRIMILLAKEW